MAKLVHGMVTSLDGYAVAAEGDLGRGAEDPEVHTFVGDRFRSVGTFLHGRRMYETMVFWETVHEEPDVPAHILDCARDWRAAGKIVYSTTLQGRPGRRVPPVHHHGRGGRWDAVLPGRRAPRAGAGRAADLLQRAGPHALPAPLTRRRARLPVPGCAWPSDPVGDTGFEPVTSSV